MSFEHSDSEISEAERGAARGAADVVDGVLRTPPEDPCRCDPVCARGEGCVWPARRGWLSRGKPVLIERLDSRVRPSRDRPEDWDER